MPLSDIHRPVSLVAQVEAALREAIEDFAFPGGRLPTLIELAEQLRVSRETVRLALESLQQEGLILKRRRRGTVVNTSSPALALKRPDRRVLAYLYRNTENGEGPGRAAGIRHGDILQGAILEASRQGYRVVPVLLTDGGMEAAVTQAQEVAPISGYIFADELDKQFHSEFRRSERPFIAVGQEPCSADTNAVVFDVQQSARCAVHYLSKLGHDRIACVHEPAPGARPRFLQGYRSAMTDAAIKRRRLWEVEVADGDGAEQAVERITEIAPMPTAVICQDNGLASRLISAASNAGLCVPEDLCVVGGGGAEVVDLCCCRLDWTRVGKTAAAHLLEWVSSKKPPKLKPHHAEHQLIPGATAVSVAKRRKGVKPKQPVDA